MNYTDIYNKVKNKIKHGDDISKYFSNIESLYINSKDTELLDILNSKGYSTSDNLDVHVHILIPSSDKTNNIFLHSDYAVDTGTFVLTNRIDNGDVSYFSTLENVKNIIPSASLDFGYIIVCADYSSEGGVDRKAVILSKSFSDTERLSITRFKPDIWLTEYKHLLGIALKQAYTNQMQHTTDTPLKYKYNNDSAEHDVLSSSLNNSMHAYRPMFHKEIQDKYQEFNDIIFKQRKELQLKTKYASYVENVDTLKKYLKRIVFINNKNDKQETITSVDTADGFTGAGLGEYYLNFKLGTVKDTLESNNVRFTTIEFEYVTAVDVKGRNKTLTVQSTNPIYKWLDPNRYVVYDGHGHYNIFDPEHVTSDLNPGLDLLELIDKLWSDESKNPLLKYCKFCITDESRVTGINFVHYDTAKVYKILYQRLTAGKQKRLSSELIKDAKKKYFFEAMVEQRHGSDVTIPIGDNIFTPTDIMYNAGDQQLSIIASILNGDNTDQFISMREFYEKKTDVILNNGNDFNEIVDEFIEYVISSINDKVDDNDKNCIAQLIIKMIIGNVDLYVEYSFNKTSVYKVNGTRVKRNELFMVIKKAITYPTKKSFNKMIKLLPRQNIGLQVAAAKGIKFSLEDSTVVTVYIKAVQGAKKVWNYSILGDTEEYPIDNSVINRFANSAISETGSLRWLKRKRLYALIEEINTLNTHNDIFYDIADYSIKYEKKRQEKQRKNLSNIIKMLNVRESTFTINGTGHDCYEVDGNSATYCVLKSNGTIYTKRDKRYICIVDKHNETAMDVKLANRLIALKNDSRVASFIHTLR